MEVQIQMAAVVADLEARARARAEVVDLEARVVRALGEEARVEAILVRAVLTPVREGLVEAAEVLTTAVRLWEADRLVVGVDRQLGAFAEQVDSVRPRLVRRPTMHQRTRMRRLERARAD
jgi:hypothetical protein